MTQAKDPHDDDVVHLGEDRWRALVEKSGPPSPDEPPCRDRDFWDGLASTLQGEGVDRRRFLQLAGASMALAGAASCSIGNSGEAIVPYRAQPPEVKPGRPTFYATSMALDGYAVGLLVESHEGRPTKIEGNPDHPMSLGATDALTQASVIDLYSTERIQRALRAGVTSGWHSFVLEASAAGATLDRTHIVLEPTGSPLVGALLARLRNDHPGLGVSFWAPLAPAERWRASRAVFGRVVAPHHDLAAADVVVSLDADFTSAGPAQLVWARGFAQRRRPEAQGGMNRLYAIEPAMTPTGSIADHRLAIPASLVAAVAARLFVEVARAVGGGGAATAALAPLADRAPRPDILGAAARDLVAHRGKALVLAGDRQPAVVHAIAYGLNEMLGGVGTTTRYAADPVLEAGEPSHDLAPVVARLEAGEVDRLLVAGGNPAYTAPADLDFGAAMRKARERVVLSYFATETTYGASWVLPEAHYLERWGDARAYDGTVSFVQPLVRPLYDARGVEAVLAAYAGHGEVDGRALLRDRWRQQLGPEPAWQEALRVGLLPDSRSPVETVRFGLDGLAELARAVPAQMHPTESLEVDLARDARMYDGRFGHNPWLSELPQPITTLTWGNAALMAGPTAAALKLHAGDVVAIEQGGVRITLPVLIADGHADGAITVGLGWGQTDRAQWRQHGTNAYPLRTRAAPAIVRGVRVTPTGRTEELAVTQFHFELEGRRVAAGSVVKALEHGRETFKAMHEPIESFHNRQPLAPAQWGMAIDLSACTGCGACMAACQAENNVPVVGREGVLKRREMHWLRIDQYVESAIDQRRIISQPMMCQHCEKAPCEYVCPVHATVHSDDGLNEMVYNRCVGTRFCSNNCPYKVRRFNWFNYHRYEAETTRMQYNPDVTVRARGVMEKCTYCVQRIREAGIWSRVSGEPIPTDQPQTACQQACPTRAIVFGNIKDPKAEVTHLRDLERAYGALHETGTDPRTRYLERIHNPNPEVQGA